MLVEVLKVNKETGQPMHIMRDVDVDDFERRKEEIKELLKSRAK